MRVLDVPSGFGQERLDLFDGPAEDLVEQVEREALEAFEDLDEVPCSCDTVSKSYGTMGRRGDTNRSS